MVVFQGFEYHIYEDYSYKQDGDVNAKFIQGTACLV